MSQVIDWERSLQLAGNNILHAKEFLDLLANDLKYELIKIKKAYSNKNYHEITSLLHKLQGALCYCSAPRLKLVTSAFEKALKENINSQSQLHLFEFEIKQFLECYEKLKFLSN
jgi:two-component system, NarL family, sensor histidine kinase BarA